MPGAPITRLSVLISPATGVTDDDLERGLRDRRGELTTLAGHVRIGVRDPRDPLAEQLADRGRPVPVQAAVEFTVPHGEGPALGGRAQDIGRILDGLIDPATSALTIGPTHHIVEPSEGSCFLALAFRREENTTIEEFRHWWYDQHAKVATPLLLPELLAYDQVHVDHTAAEKASDAAGIAYYPYDAYDNLTWASMDAFFSSVSKPGAAEEMYRDEVGHIDHATNRGSVMQLLG